MENTHLQQCQRRRRQRRRDVHISVYVYHQCSQLQQQQLEQRQRQRQPKLSHFFSSFRWLLLPIATGRVVRQLLYILVIIQCLKYPKLQLLLLNIPPLPVVPVVVTTLAFRTTIQSPCVRYSRSSSSSSSYCSIHQRKAVVHDNNDDDDDDSTTVTGTSRSIIPLRKYRRLTWLYSTKLNYDDVSTSLQLLTDDDTTTTGTAITGTTVRPVSVTGTQIIQSLQYDTIPTMVQQLCNLSHSRSGPLQRTSFTKEEGLDWTFTNQNITAGTTSTASSINEYNQTRSFSTHNLQTALVRLGMAWSQQQQQQQQQPKKEHHPTTSTGIHADQLSLFHVISSRQRVPGCISTVHVQTVLCHDIATNTTTVQSIDGITDAYMSRGLLACVANVFLNVPIHEILSMDIPQLIHQLSLETILSTGRNDGFTNMIRIIQSQIHQCVIQLHKELYNITNHITSTDNDDVVVTQLPIPLQQLPVPTIERETTETTLSSSSTTTKTRVALLLSGGVDSTVALNLLVRNNDSNNAIPYDVTAFYLKIWLEDELSDLNVCPWDEDVQYCKAVCEQLNVPLEIISLQEEYNDYILSYTIQEAKNGRTPNPDILCNRRIKFGCFYDVIMNRDFDYVATGHYAQVIRHASDDGTIRVHLHRAPDPVKDQSYFLCALSQQQLQRVLFPIGHMSKIEVRQYAEQYQVPNRYRPDSQGLCFLGKVKFDTFLNTYIADLPGPIIDAANNALVGYHRGLWYHTIGQRKGLGKVLFPTATSIGPWYVVGKNTMTNTIYCTNQYDEDIFTQTRSEFAVEGIHWIAGTPPSSTLLSATHLETGESGALVQQGTDQMNGLSQTIFHITMKIRHGPNLVQGILIVDQDDHVQDCQNDNDTTDTNQSIRGFVRLQNCKDSGLAPGQYVSFYDNHSSECYGCAVISENNWGQVQVAHSSEH